jgi:hypothetical protein
MLATGRREYVVINLMSRVGCLQPCRFTVLRIRLVTCRHYGLHHHNRTVSLSVARSPHNVHQSPETQIGSAGMVPSAAPLRDHSTWPATNRPLAPSIEMLLLFHVQSPAN